MKFTTAICFLHSFFTLQTYAHSPLKPRYPQLSPFLNTTFISSTSSSSSTTLYISSSSITGSSTFDTSSGSSSSSSFSSSNSASSKNDVSTTDSSTSSSSSLITGAATTGSLASTTSVTSSANPALTSQASITSTASSSSSQSSTVIFLTTDGSTYSEAFTPTSISQFASVTAKTTASTTDSSGHTGPLIIWPGGLAWGVVGSIPPVDIPEPDDPPVEEGSDDNDLTSTQSSTQTTSASSSSSSSSGTSSSSSSSSSQSGSCTWMPSPEPTLTDDLEGYNYDTSDTDDSEDTDDSTTSKSKRFSGSNIAGRIDLSSPSRTSRRDKYNYRRQVGDISAFGTCTFPAGVIVTQPPYPQAKTLKQWEKVKGGKEKTVLLPQTSRWWVRSGTCDSDWGIQKVDTSALEKTVVSSDHVWELNFMDRFMKSKVGTTDFTCDDMEQIFFPKDKCGNVQNNLQLIYDQLPSSAKPWDQGEFAGVDQTINGFKSMILNHDGSTAGFDSPRFQSKWITNKAWNYQIDALKYTGQAMAFMKNSEIEALLLKTNTRIYGAMQGIDALISTQKRSNGDAIPAQWANDFKSFMSGVMSDAGSYVANWVTNTVNTFQTAIDSETDEDIKKEMTSALANFRNNPYGKDEYFTMDIDLSSSYSGSTPLALKRNATCSASVSVSASSTASATSSFTSADSSPSSITSASSSVSSDDPGSSSASSNPTSQSSTASSTSATTTPIPTTSLVPATTQVPTTSSLSPTPTTTETPTSTTPTTTPTPSVDCSMSYKFLWDTFTITWTNSGDICDTLSGNFVHEGLVLSHWSCGIQDVGYKATGRTDIWANSEVDRVIQDTFGVGGHC